MKLRLMAALALSVLCVPAFAQSPVAPYYGVTTSSGAKGFQPVDSSHGLPIAAMTVATCGAQSLVPSIAAILTVDLTGTLCTSLGSGGITATVTIPNGADVAEGNTADAATTAGGVGTVSGKLRLMTTQLGTINSTLGSPFQAGGSIGNTTFAVTNAGTFPVQATLGAETTKVIGTVNQGTSPWVTSGTSTVSGTVAATQSGTWTVQPGNTANTTPWLVTPAPSSSSAVGITPVVSASGEATHVLKASAGNAYAAYASKLTSTQAFFMLINATSAPADGAVTPLACVPLAPNGVASINYSPGPPGVFSTGITAVVSSASTCFTKTTGVVTAFISGSVQ